MAKKDEEKLIGILAGMGPRSTTPFLDLVISECQTQYAAKHTKDFPHILIYSLPAPLYLDRPLDHEAVKNSICRGLKKLETAGADFIAMPCNTAHTYYNELQNCIRVPLLNIIEETLRILPSSIGKVTVLATRMTIGSGLYQRGIERAGLHFVLREEWQRKVDEIISEIQQLPDIFALENLWGILVSEIRAAGVDSIILGCTDLNVVSEKTRAAPDIIDATACLARAVVRQYLSSA